MLASDEEASIYIAQFSRKLNRAPVARNRLTGALKGSWIGWLKTLYETVKPGNT